MIMISNAIATSSGAATAAAAKDQTPQFNPLRPIHQQAKGGYEGQKKKIKNQRNKDINGSGDKKRTRINEKSLSNRDEMMR
jgi:hypothetical protein